MVSWSINAVYLAAEQAHINYHYQADWFMLHCCLTLHSLCHKKNVKVQQGLWADHKMAQHKYIPLGEEKEEENRFLKSDHLPLAKTLKRTAEAIKI